MFLGYFAFIDFVLALLPLAIIRKLQISIVKKVALGFLLSLGILYCALNAPLMVELTLL